MACYAENEDGTCPRDKTEVTLLGRTRQLTGDMEEKLDGLMKSVCLAREDLVPTKDTGEEPDQILKAWWEELESWMKICLLKDGSVSACRTCKTFYGREDV